MVRACANRCSQTYLRTLGALDWCAQVHRADHRQVHAVHVHWRPDWLLGLPHAKRGEERHRDQAGVHRVDDGELRAGLGFRIPRGHLHLARHDCLLPGATGLAAPVVVVLFACRL